MHKHEVRPAIVQYVAHAEHDRGRYVVQILTLLHDIQVEMRPYLKQRQYLIKHLPMLARHADETVDSVRLFELRNERRHLDSFWTGPERQ
jgi:hypothetical protein